VITLYHVVKSPRPTEDDFKSQKDRGIPLRDPRFRREYEGVSCCDTAATAKQLAETFKLLGQYIAQIDIPDASALTYEPTLWPGHWTIWGDGQEMLRYVVRVLHVTEV
jgi:hypothetical protein